MRFVPIRASCVTSVISCRVKIRAAFCFRLCCSCLLVYRRLTLSIRLFIVPVVVFDLGPRGRFPSTSCLFPVSFVLSPLSRHHLIEVIQFNTFGQAPQRNKILCPNTTRALWVDTPSAISTPPCQILYLHFEIVIAVVLLVLNPHTAAATLRHS